MHLPEDMPCLLGMFAARWLVEYMQFKIHNAIQTLYIQPGSEPKTWQAKRAFSPPPPLLSLPCHSVYSQLVCSGRSARSLMRWVAAGGRVPGQAAGGEAAWCRWRAPDGAAGRSPCRGPPDPAGGAAMGGGWVLERRKGQYWGVWKEEDGIIWCLEGERLDNMVCERRKLG